MSKLLQDRMPRTVEEFACLPEGAGFGVETYEFTDADRERGYAEVNGASVELRDGIRSMQWPVAGNAVAYFDDGGLHGYCDSEGVDWKLGRYADGRWFRRRC